MVDNRAHAAQDRRNIPGRFSQPQNEIPHVEQRAVPRVLRGRLHVAGGAGISTAKSPSSKM